MEFIQVYIGAQITIVSETRTLTLADLGWKLPQTVVRTIAPGQRPFKFEGPGQVLRVFRSDCPKGVLGHFAPTTVWGNLPSPFVRTRDCHSHTGTSRSITVAAALFLFPDRFGPVPLPIEQISCNCPLSTNPGRLSFQTGTNRAITTASARFLFPDRFSPSLTSIRFLPTPHIVNIGDHRRIRDRQQLIRLDRSHYEGSEKA
jgi:hypothetical protein